MDTDLTKLLTPKCHTRISQERGPPDMHSETSMYPSALQTKEYRKTVGNTLNRSNHASQEDLTSMTPIVDSGSGSQRKFCFSGPRVL
jgi:hypothetical protein